MQEAAFQTWVKSKCIGLTGGVATGKSTVAGMIQDLGFKVFDADKLSREVMLPGKPAFNEIVVLFGRSILNESGTIDRKKLGQLVFGQPELRSKLEAITHKRIKEEFLLQAVAQKEDIGSQFFFYEAALIFEVGREKDFFKTICTWCTEDEQLKRLIARNSLSLPEAKAIVASQMPANQKRDRADFVIDTNCSLDELKQKVSRAIQF
jgi:dephospho-CoA kinase